MGFDVWGWSFDSLDLIVLEFNSVVIMKLFFIQIVQWRAKV